MNAVIYARYSSDNQREESIEGQLRECMAFAESKGLTVIESYIDRALSAKIDNRPKFQRMIKESIKQKFEAIIVWKSDRFSRNRYDSAHYKAQLKRIMSEWFLLPKAFHTMLQAYYLSLCWRALLNIILSSESRNIPE